MEQLFFMMVLINIKCIHNTYSKQFYILYVGISKYKDIFYIITFTSIYSILCNRLYIKKKKTIKSKDKIILKVFLLIIEKNTEICIFLTFRVTNQIAFSIRNTPSQYRELKQIYSTSKPNT